MNPFQILMLVNTILQMAPSVIKLIEQLVEIGQRREGDAEAMVEQCLNLVRTSRELAAHLEDPSPPKGGLA